MIYRYYWCIWVVKKIVSRGTFLKTLNLKNSKRTVYLKTKDFLVTEEEFNLLYDPETEMLITEPFPQLEILSKYYDSEKYISHTDNKKGFVSFLYQLIKKRALLKKTELIFSLNKEKGDLLDIGAGTGEFLKNAKIKGWSVYGVEPNENARKLAEKKGVELKTN